MPGVNLAGPPRPVPLLVRCRVLLGSPVGQIGWFFFGFGMIFFWAFVLNSELPTWASFRGELETARGVVTHVEATKASENHARIYANHYSFTGPDRIQYEGVSYSTGTQRHKGDAVIIEFPKGNPATSRIQGMRMGQFGAAVVFVLIFPLVGLGFMLPGLWSGIKANRLLVNGKEALGTLKSKVPTNVKVNKRTVYKLTFEFVAEDGYTYQAVAKSHRPEILEDEAQEPLLYDPSDPRNAVMLDSLPGLPRIDERGQIQTRSHLKALLVLILPALTIIGHGTYLYIHFFD